MSVCPSDVDVSRSALRSLSYRLGERRCALGTPMTAPERGASDPAHPRSPPQLPALRPARGRFGMTRPPPTDTSPRPSSFISWPPSALAPARHHRHSRRGRHQLLGGQGPPGRRRHGPSQPRNDRRTFRFGLSRFVSANLRKDNLTVLPPVSPIPLLCPPGRVALGDTGVATQIGQSVVALRARSGPRRAGRSSHRGTPSRTSRCSGRSATCATRRHRLHGRRAPTGRRRSC
jgi:hypothetical protein